MAKPINDFVNSYAKSETVRFHMPGHKGEYFHGLENLDITEIKGADYLFEPSGIIKQSEEQMSTAFGTAKTLYSTEGSSLCIKSMLGMVKMSMENPNEKMLIVAPRNCHKAFINACVLLDCEVKWVYPKEKSTSICAGRVTAKDIEQAILECERAVDCVYVTSPDYLGNLSDIKGISRVCREKNITLVCDNAHGAYLNFLEENSHPIHEGADLCCDSAHKTLPCYTGGALMHISKSAPKGYCEIAKNVMSLFASTSPSYLILQSLDLCSDYVNGKYREELLRTVGRVESCKKKLESKGWKLCGDESLKITICANESGFDGNELGEILRREKIEVEYTDCQYVVMMITPFNKEDDFVRLENAMGKIAMPKIRIMQDLPEIPHAVVEMGIRQAVFSKSHKVKCDEAEGKICGMTVSCCQPSVPVVVSGEKITAQVIKILKKYSIYEINVI